MAGRLDVLTAAEADLGEGDVLRLALLHAVAELGGLGGMAHLRRTWAAGSGLRLVASSGLPRSMTRAFANVPGDADTPPSRAAREGVPAWRPATVEGNALVAVPLPDPDGPLGTLAVVLPDAAGEPDRARLAMLAEVAEWAAGRIRRGCPAEDERDELAFARTSPGDAEGVRQALRAVRVGTWEWDIRTGLMTWTQPMLTLLGIGPESFDGRAETWMSLIHPDDLPTAMAEVDRVLRARDEGEFEYRLRRDDGSWVWVRARSRVIADEDGRAARMIGTLWDTTRAHSALEAVGRALRHMSDGFLAADGEGRVTFANRQAELLLGGGGASEAPRGPGEDELTGRSLWEVPAVARVPGLADRCRRAAAEGTPAEFDAPWPDRDHWLHLRLVPVPDGLALHVTDATERRRREAEREAAERAASGRAGRIGRLTAALAEALSSRDVVTAVAEHVMSPFDASAMIVSVVEEGDRLHVVHAIGYTPGFLRMIDRQPIESAPAIMTSFRDHSPQFLASPEEFLARYPGATTLVKRSGKRAWAFLPLIVSGRAIGSCVIAFDEPRRLNGEERTLLTAISGLLAQALERARLYDEEHHRAKELQRGLLPQKLPRLPAVTAAARYLPAERGGEVGGDWYDVIPLSADRVALVIGDVMGHGLSEAATMGRLRTAVHTLADLELPPDEILGHLNDIVSDLGDDFYATCLYAVYDPATRRCVFARAGHPPPAVVYPDGGVHFPDLDPNAPLGAATPPIDTGELRLPDGSLLVLYTDGLVESAVRDIDQGMAHLAGTLATAGEAARAAGGGRDGVGGGEELEALCDDLVTALLPSRQQTSDDAALLVARTHRLRQEDIASWPLPEDPVAAGEARDHVREQLERWQLEELTTTTELLASELVGNVIRHARGPIGLRLLRSRSLICEVSDGSHTSPHVRRAAETDEGGRGLQLVAALARRWGTRFTAEGKSIWTEQALPQQRPEDERAV
ncbi:SpoIIE family protein phosphatase [Streptomyces sp. 6N223]|uniref:SpoIIE family protein phosphatase n=1 Tax=Streptomyces sp. 6N223 TaxID=3457412 RepID=UPI003FD28E46